tara:strand:- start:94 stop:294 length:201 start_codon:yes stop_codon:yes gene_type:complete
LRKSSAFTSGSSKVEVTKESSAALETVLDTFDTFVSPDELALVLSLNEEDLLKKTPKKKRKSELLS